MSATLADAGFDIDRLTNCELAALRDRLDDLDQGATPNPRVGEAYGLVCAAYNLLTAAADISRDAYELDDDTLALAYVTSLIFGKTTTSLDADSIRGAIRAIACDA
jgi:hypothetical protein